MQDVLLTGAFGTVGTAVIDHLADRDGYEFTYLDRTERDSRDGVVADMSDYGGIRPAFEGKDAVVHLAGHPRTDGSWGEVLPNNVVGTYNALEAARDAGGETFVFASSNHVVGMYEAENAPAIYEPGFGLTVDHRSPGDPTRSTGPRSRSARTSGGTTSRTGPRRGGSTPSASVASATPRTTTRLATLNAASTRGGGSAGATPTPRESPA